MGLLDSLFSSDGGGTGLLDDPRGIGQMNMAMGLLAAGGPSTRPTSFGQALAQAYGQGMQGYQGAQDRQRENALRDLQMRQTTLGLQKTETDLAKQKRLEDAYKDFYTQSGAATATPSMETPGLTRVPMDNPAFPRQPMPEWMAQALPAPVQTQPAAKQQTATPDNYARRLQFAQFLETRGQFDEAAKHYDLAEKFKPKVKDWQKVNVGGQVLYAPYFEDGTVGQPVPYQVAERLHFANAGGTTVGLDSFTGQAQASVKNTQSPDSVASNGLGWANYTLSKQNADRLQHVNVDNQPMTFNPKTGRYDTGIGPNGQPLPQTAKPLTEAQSKDNLFGTRMREADKTLSTFEAQGVTRPGNIKTLAEGAGRVLGLGTESLGGTLSDVMGSATNWTQSPGQQQVDQARRDFLNAVLRKESGAAIAPSEFSSAEKQYFPQAGDSAAVLSQKALNRQIAIQGVLSGVPGGSRMKQLPAAQLPGGWTVTEK